LALLAGGQARRLGGIPKGLLTWKGEPVVQRLAALGTAYFAEVLLVTNAAEPYAHLGLRAVGDQLLDKGPPGGVHAALWAARTPWVLALGCDMPFITRESLGPLLEARAPQEEAVLYEVAGRLEPLVGLYAKALEGHFRQALQGGAPSFARILEGRRVRRLPEDALRAVDPTLNSVESVNTPEAAVRHGLGFPSTLR
jgi:molybdopterin-guanine dinucleotide biosynthesis protein A